MKETVTMAATSGGASAARAAPSGEPVLDVRGLRRTYRSLVAVDDLTLQIERGSVVGFLGLNGAGKTTAMRMMCGLIRPDAGSVTIGGHDLASDPARATQRIGYVADQCQLHRWMRVREAVDFHRRLRPGWDDGLAVELQELFALDPERRVKALSKGMKAKLSLLLAMAHRPDILLLDEPMDGLDLLVREEFLDGLLRQVIDAGQTILFSTHGLADVDRIADSVAILHHGRLLTHTPMDTLLTATRGLRISGIENPADLDLASLTQLFAEAAPDARILGPPRRDRQGMVLAVRGEAVARTAAVDAIRSAHPGATITIETLPLSEIFRAMVSDAPADQTMSETSR